MTPELLPIVQAAYRVDLAPEAWLEGMLTATPALFPDATPRLALSFETPAEGAPRLDVKVLGESSADELRADLEFAWRSMPAFFWSLMRAEACGRLARSLPDFQLLLEEARAPFSPDETLYVKAVDRHFEGCVVLLLTQPPRVRIDPKLSRAWARAAEHVAAGWRLRREVDTRRPAPRRRRGPRWALIERFTTRDAPFLVARHEPGASGIEALSSRERQVVGCACLGYSNEMIAAELQLKASTVRVLLSRAVGKLGFSSTRELIETSSLWDGAQ